MNKNVGSTERIIRIVIAIIVLAAKFLIPLTGIVGIIALVVAAIAIITSLVNFCPLWAVFGINTYKK